MGISLGMLVVMWRNGFGGLLVGCVSGHVVGDVFESVFGVAHFCIRVPGLYQVESLQDQCLPSHLLTWKCTNSCRKTTFILVSWPFCTNPC